MSQTPLKKVKVQNKPSKYRKGSKKYKDETSRIKNYVNKKTVELSEQRCRLIEEKESKRRKR